MFRILAIVAAAFAGAAIWRRHEIRSDAERASKAITSAASSARQRIQPGSEDGEGGDVGEAGEAESSVPAQGDTNEQSAAPPAAASN